MIGKMVLARASSVIRNSAAAELAHKWVLAIPKQ